jgi:hypothetical protein
MEWWSKFLFTTANLRFFGAIDIQTLIQWGLGVLATPLQEWP